jgi:alpha-L-arabinofuranosidase
MAFQQLPWGLQYPSRKHGRRNQSSFLGWEHHKRLWVGFAQGKHLQRSKLNNKIVNTGNQTVPLTIALDDDSYQNVNGTTLQNDDPNAFNTVEQQDNVAPRQLTRGDLPVLGSTGFEWTVPVFSSTVLQFDK